MEQESLKFHIRLRVFRTEPNFGPGVTELMLLVRERGSLAAACKEMNMAYSKAWKIMNNAQRDLGFPLMEGRRGGESGGNTVLTEAGAQFLDRYLAFELESRTAVDSIFRKYFTE